MAEAAATTENEDKKLHDIFVEAWNIFEELDQTSLPFNSAEFQEKVKTSMEHFENGTKIVSQIGLFSVNELIDEVSTESLQYLLLPFFLGKLALKLNAKERLNVLEVSEVYFSDYLQRCQEYELCDAAPKDRTVAKNDSSTANGDNSNELAELMRSANSRNNKIAQFRRKKELEEQIKLMREAVKNESIDDDAKREFFLNFIKKSIIDANEELDSLKLEKQMVEMHKLHMSAGKPDASNFNENQVDSAHTHSHGHAHTYGAHSRGPPRPKPLQPFIITRNNAQKAVFGMGYPSLPIMTVDEFYTQRVADGVFPDEEKVAKMNQAQAIAAAQNENEKEDDEQAVVELQVENDDAENLARMRRMDEYKDVVRRGDGNRHNRS